MDVRDVMRDESKIAYVNVLERPETVEPPVEEEASESIEEEMPVNDESRETTAAHVERHRRSDTHENRRVFVTPTIIKTAVGVVAVSLIIGTVSLLRQSKYSDDSKSNSKSSTSSNKTNGFTVERHSGSANSTYNANLDKIHNNSQEYLEKSKQLSTYYPMSEKEFLGTLDDTLQMI